MIFTCTVGRCSLGGSLAVADDFTPGPCLCSPSFHRGRTVEDKGSEDSVKLPTQILMSSLIKETSEYNNKRSSEICDVMIGRGSSKPIHSAQNINVNIDQLLPLCYITKV